MATCYNLFMNITSWNQFFEQEKNKLYFSNMLIFIDKVYEKANVFPSKNDIFNAFLLTPLDEVKVVILGQDPYHQPGQAMGLSFSVPKTIKPPPSLVNIFKEIRNDLNCEVDFTNGDLTYLAKQGVLLLNAILTVEQDKPLSHDIEEYRIFTRNVFQLLSTNKQPIVYLLWGNSAHKMEKYITASNCLIIKTSHPSPLAANRGGFFGLHQFSKTNDFLIKNKRLPIKWNNV